MTVTALSVAGLTACSPLGGGTRAATAPATSTASAASAPAQPDFPARPFTAKVTLAPDTGLAPGPFSVVPVSCGPLSRAQQRQFRTSAVTGLVYKFTNESQSFTGSLSLGVRFTTGSALVGSGTTGTERQLAPGQSGQGEADAVSPSGAPLETFTGCQLTAYGITAPGGNVQPEKYAPRP